MNPIINAWGIVSHRLYENGGQFKALEDLIVELQKVWDEVEVLILQSPSNSMPKRLSELLGANGGVNRYYD